MKRWWEENGSRLAFQLEVAMPGKLLVPVMKYQRCCRVKGEFCSLALMSQNDEALPINHVNARSYFTFEFYVGFFPLFFFFLSIYGIFVHCSTLTHQ